MTRARVLIALSLAVTAAGCKKDEPRQPVVAAPTAPPPGAGSLPAPPPGGALAPMQVPGSPGGQIAALEGAVKANPKDVQSWIQLGNAYFDTKQPQRSIDAYAKALELQPNNPDVLTDQGVMYRDLQAYDKAVANFAKANQLNPQHAQSLFNLGVVYAFDLNQPQKAREAWSKLIAVNPGSPQAQTALQALADLQNREQGAAAGGQGGAGPAAPAPAPGGGPPPGRFAPINK